MAQNITLMGASYTAVPAVTLPKTGGGTASFTDVTDTTAAASDVASGKYFYTAAGVRTQGTNSGGGGGGGMNKQIYFGSYQVTSNTYTATDVKLKVAVTGTYKISWCGWRNTTSGTSGSQLYKNGTAIGTANTSFTITNYGQVVTLTGISLAANDEIVVRARARSSSYQMHVANLCIEQTS